MSTAVSTRTLRRRQVRKIAAKRHAEAYAMQERFAADTPHLAGLCGDPGCQPEPVMRAMPLGRLQEVVPLSLWERIRGWKA